jgi:hypothetical protein
MNIMKPQWSGNENERREVTLARRDALSERRTLRRELASDDATWRDTFCNSEPMTEVALSAAT